MRTEGYGYLNLAQLQSEEARLLQALMEGREETMKWVGGVLKEETVNQLCKLLKERCWNGGGKCSKSDCTTFCLVYTPFCQSPVSLINSLFSMIVQLPLFSLGVALPIKQRTYLM